jgi:guanylate kinase
MTTTNNMGTIFIISGPSGVGKTTIVERLLEAEPGLKFSVSLTTRDVRADDKPDGVKYHFVTNDEFAAHVAAEDFLEHAVYSSGSYGTLKSEVLPPREQGIDVVLDIEVQGMKQIKQLYPEAIAIFLLPPSFEVLEDRLRKRNDAQTENKLSEEKILQRLATARYEIKQQDLYDYKVVNGDLDDAVAQVLEIVRRHRRKV